MSPGSPTNFAWQICQSRLYPYGCSSHLQGGLSCQEVSMKIGVMGCRAVPKTNLR